MQAMPKSKSSLIDLLRIATPAAVLALTAATSFLHAEEDMSKPEIKVEKKKDADNAMKLLKSNLL